MATITTEEEVRQTSDQFYAALVRMLNGDVSALDGVWSHSEATVLPPAPPLARNLGWEQVRSDFQFFARLARDGGISQRDRLIVAGNDMAYTTQIETVRAKMGDENVSFTGRSSTVYRREDGAWKVTLHHIDFAPELAEAVGKMMQQAGRTEP